MPCGIFILHTSSSVIGVMENTFNVLTVVFTYNRPRLLKNAVDSIDRYFPWGDRLIVDDGSNSNDAVAMLEQLSKRDRWKVEIRERANGISYGGFYRNMDWALKYAASSNYDYCLFFEDDEQFVWHFREYPNYVKNLFSQRDDCHLVQPLFMRRIHNWHGKAEYISEVRSYRTSRGFTTTGVWNLDIVRREGNPGVVAGGGDCLPHNSQLWLKKGYRLYLQADPTVAILPWVDSQIDGARSSVSHQGNDSESLLLKQLTSMEQNWLRERDPKVMPCQEYFELSDKNSARPIWHQKGRLMSRYFKLCADTYYWENRSGLRGNVVTGERECLIEPEMGHINLVASTAANSSLRPINLPKNIIKRYVFVILKMMAPRNIDVGDMLAIRPSQIVAYYLLKYRMRSEQRAMKRAGC